MGGPRWTGAERRAVAEDMAARYCAGATLNKIAREFGTDRTTVRRLLAEIGVELPPRPCELEDAL